MINVLFVCLGNICRSPLAEGIFIQQCHEFGLDKFFKADSAGTASYHIGNLADPRSREVALKHGIKLTHKARAFTINDFDNFDLIVAMDEQNFADIKRLQPAANITPVALMCSFQSKASSLNVPDPYYGNIKDFEAVYDLLTDCCSGLIKHLKP